MKLGRIAREIQDSPTLAITAKAKALRADGVDVIGFGAGEPDFDTPEHIKAAADEALKSGFTKYTPASGIPELKEAIAAKLKKDNGLEYAPREVIVSCGAKQVLYNAIRVLCDEGDEVIIPAPYWVTYPEQVKAAGGVAVIVNTGGPAFKMTVQQFSDAVTPRTKAFVLNSPCNPTGAVYTKSELRDIAEVAVEKQVVLITDEVYEKFVYDGLSHHSIAALGQEIKALTIVVNAVSKTYSMTGWRIGYAAGPAEVIAAMGRLQSQTTSGANSIAQKASVAALTGPQECVEEMVEEFDVRRKLMASKMSEIVGEDVPAPQGAFYLLADTSPLLGKTYEGVRVDTPTQLADYLLDAARVAVVPGEGFGTDKHIRLSYATSREAIEKGLDRIAQSLGRPSRK